jgi:hypothetical protein
MKYSRLSFVLFAAMALIITGCGKTQEQLKMEKALNTEVKTLQKDVESNLAGFSDLQARLDATLKMHKELAKKYAKKMKGYTAEDVTAAGKGLDAAKVEAETALKALKAYDKEMDHEKAVLKLKQDKQSLTMIKDKIVGATSSANTAITNHEKMKSQLTAKAPAKAKAHTKARAKKTASKKARR